MVNRVETIVTLLFATLIISVCGWAAVIQTHRNQDMREAIEYCAKANAQVKVMGRDNVCVRKDGVIINVPNQFGD